ncbi:MAG: murein L,D-transpeptidase [Acidimicrobiia bacterium]|nr:murein L,D-transpeptidase [Acidimicrobiia bacterium]
MIRRLAATAVLLATALNAAPAAAEESPLPPSLDSTLVRLEPGDSGPDVARMQQALADAGFYHFEIDGVFGRGTETAVIALHKYLGIDRTATFDSLDWVRLAQLPPPGIPNRWNEKDYIEIDIARQLLFLVRGGRVTQILPVSTGSGNVYWSVRNGSWATSRTPRGDFVLQNHQYGWGCDSVTGWCVYKYWGFSRFYGVHGYRSVPTYPASHGCVRVTIADADWLEPHLFIGMPIHVWDTRPYIPPPPGTGPAMVIPPE